jgi:hypothetical protein
MHQISEIWATHQIDVADLACLSAQELSPASPCPISERASSSYVHFVKSLTAFTASGKLSKAKASSVFRCFRAPVISQCSFAPDRVSCPRDRGGHAAAAYRASERRLPRWSSIRSRPSCKVWYTVTSSVFRLPTCCRAKQSPVDADIDRRQCSLSAVNPVQAPTVPLPRSPK